MLSSTSAYLIALRNGDYFRFLEWPRFVEEKYGRNNESLGLDLLLNCLIFEWLKNGFYAEDLKKIAVLYAVHELEPSPLQAGKYAFTLMTLTSVLFSSMVYAEYCFAAQELIPNLASAKAIFAYLDEQAKVAEDKIKQQKGDDANFSQAISLMRDVFMVEVPLVDKAVINQVAKRIRMICMPLNIIEDYRLALSLVRNEERNELFDSRLGIVNQLYSYLQEQSELTEEVYLQMVKSVRSLRSQDPFAWEETFLEKISSPTLLQQSLVIMSYMWGKLFSQSTSAVAVATEASDESPPTQGFS